MSGGWTACQWVKFASVLVINAVVPLLATAEESAGREFNAHFRPFFQQHCVACHGEEHKKGNLRLDKFPFNLDETSIREKWKLIVERLQSGEMPPRDQPRPPTKDVQSLLEWLAPRITAAEKAARAAQGRVVLRRLNRSEYERTICDLLGIQIPLKEQLPQDGSADGFDNAAAAQHTSSFLMEKYLEAADTALNAAIASRPNPPPVISKRYSLKEGHPIRGSTEDVYRFLDDGTVICFCSSEWHNVSISPFYPPDTGRYRFRISASAVQNGNKPLTFRVTTTGTRLTGKSGLIGYFDAPADKPTMIEFERSMEPRTTISLLPYGLAGANTVKQTGGENWEGPGLAIQFVDVRKRRSIWGDVRGIDLFPSVIGHATTVDDHAFAISRDAIMLAPTANAVKVFERETGWIDVAVTDRARLIGAMFRQLLANGGRAANVRVNR
jgi:hypothetical protein